MRFLSILLFSSVALAQNASINVGGTQTTPGGIFQFMPNTITATNDSVITFQFTGAPGNHSVTQSTFANTSLCLTTGILTSTDRPFRSPKTFKGQQEVGPYILKV
ncbi:hypothetical protein C8J56DRAFT_898696 [Mycena floridula]|nr:hypothetical protein C8J56DRAFT_898696 [Mycena floridula]